MSIVTDKQAGQICGVEESDPVLVLIKPLVEREVIGYCKWDLNKSTRTEFYPAAERGGEYDEFTGTSGGHSRILQLKGMYVRPAGLEVFVDDDGYMGQGPGTPFATDTELALGTDFILDLDDAGVSRSGQLIHLGGTWPKILGSIKVVYVAGFDATDYAGTTGCIWDASDIVNAVLISIQTSYAKAVEYARSSTTGLVSGGFTSETIQGYSYTRSAEIVSSVFGRGVELPGEAKKILHRYMHYGVVI